MNSVEIIGVLQEKIDSDYREIEYALPTFNFENKNLQKVVCRFWTNNPDSRFIKSENLFSAPDI